MLNADITKYDAEAARLATEIAQHDLDIATWTEDSKAATKVREIELTDYTATHKDYSESIFALEGAIGTLQKVNKDVAQASAASAALVQVSSGPLFPPESKKVIDAFISMDQKEDENLAVA